MSWIRNVLIPPLKVPYPTVTKFLSTNCPKYSSAISSKVASASWGTNPLTIYKCNTFDTDLQIFREDTKVEKTWFEFMVQRLDWNQDDSIELSLEQSSSFRYQDEITSRYLDHWELSRKVSRKDRNRRVTSSHLKSTQIQQKTNRQKQEKKKDEIAGWSWFLVWTVSQKQAVHIVVLH